MPQDLRSLTILVNGEEPGGLAFLGLHCHHPLWCVDGGYRWAHQLGRQPDLALGDFDSVGEDLLLQLQARHVPMIRYPSDKDASDLELAIREASSRGYQRIRLLAASGGRIDHFLFNFLAMFHLAAALKVQLTALSQSFEATSLSPHCPVAEYHDCQGSTLSLISLTPQCSGVTITGAKYPLVRAQVEMSSSLGLSNQISEPYARVEIESGLLLAIQLKSLESK